MRLTRSAPLAAIALATLVFAGNAGAQDGAAQAPAKDGAAVEAGGAMPWGMGPGMMGFGGPGFGMMHGHRHGSMCAAMNSDVEGRLAYLKAELKITAQQETLWSAVASAERDNAKAMTDHCKTAFETRNQAALSLPERLDRHEQMMAAGLEAARNLNRALKPLYATFSDSQKETADELFWGPFGGM